MPPRSARLLLALLTLTAACAGGDDAGIDRAATTTTAADTTTTPPETTTTTAPDLDPRAADDPQGLAAQIVHAEGAIADPATTGDELRAAGRLQQVVYRALSTRPEWDEAVDAALPEGLRPIARANVDANRELRSTLRLRDTLPAWRIVEAAPADELRRYYEEGQSLHGVPWEYLAAVHLVESRMGRLRGISTAGAQGPMQFIPSTWDAYGEGDINDNRDAIVSAARYMAANGGDCREGAPCNLDNALHRYNPAPTGWYKRAVTAFAERIRADERAHLGYHEWQVFYATTLGDVWLRIGYEEPESRAVTEADVANGAGPR
ncbi:MAG TPA: lytic transglycosylase domain-containing protein [Acidimicrobiales bacterium]|nr:lytic transglycosylase domain-containing protein [Acidimicrobiales bacterium]